MLLSGFVEDLLIMRRLNFVVLTVAGTFGCTFWQPTLAQNMQGWQNSEQNSINQAQSYGAINGNQAARLDQQEAAINAQRQQDLMQNGGHLTNGERAQLGSEMQQVNNHMQHDENHDARRRGHHGQWRNGMQGQFPNGMQGQYPNGMQGQFPNGMQGQFPNGMRPGYPGYAPNAYAPNANGFVPNANGFVPNANGFVPNPNGYAPNGYAPNANYQNGQRGGMMNTIEHLLGGQGGHNF
jgi:hypothetical protein